MDSSTISMKLILSPTYSYLYLIFLSSVYIIITESRAASLANINHRITFEGLRHGFEDIAEARRNLAESLKNLTGYENVTIESLDDQGASWYVDDISDSQECPREDIEKIVSSIKDSANEDYTRRYKLFMTEDFGRPKGVRVDYLGVCESYQDRKRSRILGGEASQVIVTTTTVDSREETTEPTTNPTQAPTTTQSPTTLPPFPDFDSNSTIKPFGLDDSSSESSNTTGFENVSVPPTTTTTTTMMTPTTTTTPSPTTTSSTQAPTYSTTQAPTTSTQDPSTTAAVPATTLKVSETSEDISTTQSPSTTTTTTSSSDPSNSSWAPQPADVANVGLEEQGSPHFGKYIGLGGGFLIVLAYLVCSRAYRRQGMYELQDNE